MPAQDPQGDTPISRVVKDTTHRVSVEIIREIFTQFLPPIMDVAGREELTKLRLVSKRWNDTVQRTPVLWSNLLIILGTKPYPFQNVAGWFNRSGTVPKTLTIFAPPHYNETPKQCLLTKTGLPHFLEEGPALDQLRITSNSGKCYRHLLESVSNRLLWDRLSLVSFASIVEVPLDASNFLSLSMPQSLTAFELHLPTEELMESVAIYPTNTISFQIPPKLLRSLTSFSLRCDWNASPIILATLQHCISATALTLNLEDGQLCVDDSDPLIEPIIRSGLLLPQLRTLRLRQCRPSAAAKLLNLLKAPNSHHVDISFEREEVDLEREKYLDCAYGQSDVDPYFKCRRISNEDEIRKVDLSFARAVGVFMGRSGSHPSNLRSLRLHYASIKAPVLSKLMESLDSLTHLILDELDLDDGCFKDSRASSVLPNLEVLELLGLPREYDLEHVDKFMLGEEGDQGATLKTTYRDPELCCPVHSHRRPSS